MHKAYLLQIEKNLLNSKQNSLKIASILIISGLSLTTIVIRNPVSLNHKINFYTEQLYVKNICGSQLNPKAKQRKKEKLGEFLTDDLCSTL